MPTWATGPALHNIGPRGMSLVDVSIACSGTGGQTAINTTQSTYMRDIFVRGCAVAINQASAPMLPGPPSGSWLHVAEYAKGAGGLGRGYTTDVIYPDGKRVAGGIVSRTATLSGGAMPPLDLVSKHMWSEMTFKDMGASRVADARRDCGAKGDDKTDDTVALQTCMSKHKAVFLPPGMFRYASTRSHSRAAICP